LGNFRDRVLWTVCLVWLQTTILLIFALWVARIIGMSHQRLVYSHSCSLLEGFTQMILWIPVTRIKSFVSIELLYPLFLIFRISQYLVKLIFIFYFFFFFWDSYPVLSQAGLTWSSCLSLLSAGIKGIYHILPIEACT
jgi:hypothetical protein